MTRYAVQMLNTFVEVAFVEAESEEEAKEIAVDADSNASKWLGTQIVEVHEFSEQDYETAHRLDSYVWRGFTGRAEDGTKIYYKEDGSVHGTEASNMS
jgi:hypothetical protein